MKPFTYIHKILSIALIVLFLSTPFVSYAETAQEKRAREAAEAQALKEYKAGATNDFNKFNGSTNTNGGVDTAGAPRAVIVDENGGTYLPATLDNSQSRGLTNGGQTLDGGAAGGYFGSCILGSGITNAVKGAIGEIVGSVTEVIRVPTSNPVQEGKETGTKTTAYISWDSLGWCMANALVATIGDATVNWINSGFQGNPAFVEDPEQFFADVADIQAGAFINEISSGLLCTPLKDLVRINLAANYNNGINNSGQQCTFTVGLEQFMSGESFSWTDWLNYTQNPYNNPYGATIYSQIQLDQRIASALGVQSMSLSWGSGFLSKKDANGKITSPGSVIEKQVNERLFSGQRRLEIADEFDEIVDALIGQVIKFAVNEVTSAAADN